MGWFPGPRDGVVGIGQDPVELAAGADAELGEDLAQVVLDRARADEQPGADLRVGQPVPRTARVYAAIASPMPSPRALASAEI